MSIGTAEGIEKEQLALRDAESIRAAGAAHTAAAVAAEREANGIVLPEEATVRFTKQGRFVTADKQILDVAKGDIYDGALGAHFLLTGAPVVEVGSEDDEPEVDVEARASALLDEAKAEARKIAEDAISAAKAEAEKIVAAAKAEAEKLAAAAKSKS